MPLYPVLAADSGAFRKFAIKGWKVTSKSAQATVFREKSPYTVSRASNYTLTTGQDRLQPGIIFSIEIERTTT